MIPSNCGLRMETTTLHAQFEGIITVLLRRSCGSAKPSQREKLRARALHYENGRGGPMMHWKAHEARKRLVYELPLVNESFTSLVRFAV